MKFSEQWLRTWVDLKINTRDLSDQLTLAGLEVASVEPVAGEFSGVVTGQVVAVSPHPRADDLHICQVETGADHRLKIICGAANVRVGIGVAVAGTGARLANGAIIKKTQIKGEESAGMLCSAAELELSDVADEILTLPADLPAGKDLHDYLQLDDCTIHIDLTPNRADCLSVFGIAREVAALNDCAIEHVSVKPVKTTHDQQLPVTIRQPEACAQYLGRIVCNVDLQALTPLWMQERLRRSGLRAINPIVDVTNYVMLEIGQPLHAFDLARLKGSIIVRHAEPGEQLQLLDGKLVTLDEDILLIADEDKALALAGIMGGAESAVNSATTDIFLESAYFSPEAISGHARRFGLSTDSSHRFERGVDPALQAQAIERATALLQTICGGKAGPVTQAKSDKHLPSTKNIKLRWSRISKVLGVNIVQDNIAKILRSLGMSVKQVKDEWHVQIPSYRFDLSIEEDLIEEVARIYGYNQLPARNIVSELCVPPASNKLKVQRLGEVLVDRGYREVIHYSFIDPQIQRLFNFEAKAIDLLNPISTELSQMRVSLWPGLLLSVYNNQSRQHADLRLFEQGLCFKQQSDVKQTRVIAGVVAGRAQAGQWDAADRDFDFFDIKADVQSLLKLTHDGEGIDFISHQHPVLHPGQSAKIERQGQLSGWIGALHPRIIQRLDLLGPIFLFELDLAQLEKVVLPKFKAFSKFPAIRRDISFIIDETVTAQQIKEEIIQAGGNLLQKIEFFDIYQGEGIARGKKSVAIGLIFQHYSRTLTDSEVTEHMNSVIHSLTKAYTIMLRD